MIPKAVCSPWASARTNRNGGADVGEGFQSEEALALVAKLERIERYAGALTAIVERAEQIEDDERRGVISLALLEGAAE